MIENETIQNNNIHSQLLNNDSMEPTTVHIDTSSEQLSKHPVQITPEDLRIHLEPIIHKMIASALSYSFQQPADSISLKILDNPTTIKHSIDMSIIHNKLLYGKYNNPLEFSDDIWTIFNNIWLYNEKTSPIYEICSKLADLFVELIDPVLQTLGYCCGRQYVYSPGVLLCYGKEQCCQILVNDNYYYYNNLEPSRLNLSNDQYRFCTQCFNSIEKLDQEDREKQEAEDLDDPIESENPTELSGKRRSVNTCKKKNLKKMANQMLNCTDLLSAIFSTMEKYKEAFFVIRLHDQTSSHPAFFCDKNYEFSSLRRAKFFTMALLYELHTSKTEKCIYSCNICRQQCDIRYHCTKCEDFDLCEKFYNMELKREHNMERRVS
ncbi:unnamed protein product [Rotaria magnacalcarata]|uniref:histone acetyltransferase n=3 Tax=Rotaria magnacalcarata TaxID=392030 RepID=A0A815THP2_9BILA|nr:unnamed protein product [Rotaria magnacalcarata]